MIDCVLLAMRVHQQNLTIQEHACSLLELLAENRMLTLSISPLFLHSLFFLYSYSSSLLLTLTTARYKHEIIMRGGRACVKTAIFSVGLNGRGLLQKLSRKTILQNPPDLGRLAEISDQNNEYNNININNNNGKNTRNFNPPDFNNHNYTYSLHNDFSIPDLYDDDIQLATKPFANDTDFVGTAISNFNTFGESHFTTTPNFSSSEFGSRMNNSNNNNKSTKYQTTPLPNLTNSSSNHTHTGKRDSKTASFTPRDEQHTTTTTSTTPYSSFSCSDNSTVYGMDVDFP